MTRGNRLLSAAALTAVALAVPAVAQARSAPRAPLAHSAGTARGAAAADARAAAAVRAMTLKEKITLLSGDLTAMLSKAQRPDGVPVGAGYIAGLPRLGVPPQIATDASLGVSNLMDMRRGDVATAMPSGMAQAATWNPALVRAGGEMIGAEAKAKGFNVMLAGGANLVRDPRAGRNFEYLGEDPLLAGRLVGAQIAGIQSNRIVSTIKHFALNDQETGRSSASVEMPESAARESDLLAFEIGIEQGNPGSVMCSYNLVGGKFACENPFLLTDVLRRDWGYKGYVMSDWGAVHSTEALLAGLDQQSGQKLDAKRWFSTELEAAVAAGRVPVAAVDAAARRIVRSLLAHGVDAAPVPAAIDYAAHAAVAQRAAEEGIVLLRNEGGVLPLAASARRIVVIGGNADIGVLSGGGSSSVVPVGGFAKSVKLDGGPAATFARRAYGGSAPLAALKAALPQAEIVWNDGSDPVAAAAAARGADLAIVFGEKFETEAADSPDLSLDLGGDALIDAVAAANPKTVVVLEIGNPVAMPWQGKVAAILAAWYPGQKGGEAIAGVLTGRVNPSGRLPVTFPAAAAQLPNPVLPGSNLPPPDKEARATYGINTNSPPFQIHYPEGSDAGYRWFDRTGAAPLYAFGQGLSYTSFAYSGLAVRGGRTVTATFRVTNTGRREGADVPQLYVRLPGKAKRLVGWDKVVLKPGESRTITLTADPRLLASYDAAARAWVVAGGPVKVELSRSAVEPVITGSARLVAARLKP